MFYFSYGSNMSWKRLRARVPSAEKIGTGILDQHLLRFHKSGRDKSAKCDAYHSGDPEHRVVGVLYKIHPDEKPALDEVEGVGSGYEIKDVVISQENGIPVEAFTYYATDVDADLKPFDWYRQHVLIGAREHNLPDEYVEAIEVIEFVEDNNAERRARELSIYL